MAWGNFAYDLTNFNEATFIQALDEISDAGGNSMRWWMHVNGTQSPRFTDKMVSGLSDGEIENVKRVLDLAQERRMVISLCLWSFDMLQGDHGIDFEQNLNLLEKPEYTQAYIDNALIPMVNELKGHPAIMCWEVFNEPEGMTTEFGWTPQKTQMKYVQQFINLVAGAIHRVAPNEKVSNGSWSFQASTNIGGNKNYYSNSELIAAGGDSLGTLDFYMVHYYNHFPTSRSPFHHSSIYWNLDKPLVIAEFAASGPYSGISPQQAYEYLYDNGYAGALSWTWTGHDGNGDVTDATPGMMSLFTNHPEDIIINPVFMISNFKAYPTDIEEGETAELSWEVFKSNSVTINGELVETKGTMIVTPDSTTTYILIAADSTDHSILDTATVLVNVVDPNQINRALNMPVIASTFEACCGDLLYPENAFDNNFDTRWSSAWNTDGTEPNYDGKPDDQWIQVDLGETIDVELITLNWESAYGKTYNIEISYDGYLWNSAFEEANSNGGIDSIMFDTPVSARYVRMHGTDRATEYGFSLWEMPIYGTISSIKPPTISLNTNIGNVLNSGMNIVVEADTSGNTKEIANVTFSVDGVLADSLTETPYQFNFTVGDNSEYEVTAIIEDVDGIRVQSDPYTIYQNNRTLTRFEAELASTTGDASEISSPGTSGGAYMEMEDAWTITFDNIGISSNGNYLLTIGYQLTFNSPKEQYLVVNGDTLETIKFTALNTSTWLKHGVEIPLVSGTNSIAIHGIWNWMSFDYIEVENATIVGVNDSELKPLTFNLNQNYPNPFNPSTVISYSIPRSGNVSIKIYDIQGQLVSELISEFQTAGNHSINFDASRFSSGVYFYSLKSGEFRETKSMMFLK